MGYAGKLMAHSLRSITNTYLNNQGFNSDLIEMALSPLNSDRVKTTYDTEEKQEKRFELSQACTDFLEQSS